MTCYDKILILRELNKMAKEYFFHEEFSKYPNTGIAARGLGVEFYYTGKKCSKGHYSLRYASSGNCRECIAEKRGKAKLNFRGKSSKRTDENQKIAEKYFENGFTTYISKTACPKGHYERFITSNNCTECSKESVNKRKELARWARIKKEYGLTKEMFEKKMLNQNGRCEICNSDISNKQHIDHDHKTGMVRGILCGRCNQAIGLLKECPDRLKNTIKYLGKYNAKRLPT